ncbi:MAG TPA: hypothetical protein VK612_04310 [Pyrinomonadaceae bacterium]|nr:hypothetical protein [Pyrinomonadaceae bacterium]
MLRKVSSTAIWLFIFMVLVAVQAYSAYGQSSEITGYWKTASVGSIQYQNRVTGASKPGRGSLFTYKFSPNGSYEYIGYMEITMYNCTMTLFNQIKGKYSVNGSTISLNPARDFWKNTNSCSASSNKQQTKTPTKKTLEFQTKTDDYSKQLLCLTEGESETCYRREKE